MYDYRPDGFFVFRFEHKAQFKYLSVFDKGVTFIVTATDFIGCFYAAVSTDCNKVAFIARCRAFRVGSEFLFQPFQHRSPFCLLQAFQC